jgi:hypothetical protein
MFAEIERRGAGQLIGELNDASEAIHGLCTEKPLVMVGFGGKLCGTVVRGSPSVTTTSSHAHIFKKKLHVSFSMNATATGSVPGLLNASNLVARVEKVRFL